MQKLFESWNSKRFLSSLPDFWFLAILFVGWGENIAAMLSGKWSAVDMIFGSILLILTVLVVRQLFNRKAGLSFFMGLLFLVGSLYLSLALVSELGEFSVLNEPGAIRLLLGGVFVVGSSLVMSVMMMIRNSMNCRL